MFQIGSTLTQEDVERFMLDRKQTLPNGLTLWNRRGWNGNGFGNFTWWVATMADGTVMGVFTNDGKISSRRVAGRSVRFRLSFNEWKAELRALTGLVDLSRPGA